MENTSIKNGFTQFWSQIVSRTGDMIETANTYTDTQILNKVGSSSVTEQINTHNLSSDVHENKLNKNGDGKFVTVTFDDYTQRVNLVSEETLSASLGKIKYWLSSLGSAAFTDSSSYALSDGSGVIIPSSTSGSTKKFRITVDDNGTITATEVS